MALPLASDVPLAPLTTLELGGPARWFLRAEDEATVAEALRWAEGRGVPVFLLGGGSNLVVGDAGFEGLVLQVAPRGLSFREGDGDEVLVSASAGQPWDALVTEAVSRGLAGIECLAGIPGLVGATPIQNVGAYGQDVSETIRRVRLLDRRSMAVTEVGPEACGFGYRDSAFKRTPDRHVVLAVTFALRRGGPPSVRYAELREALAGQEPTLAGVRDTVVSLRRRKSMVLDPADENRRSAGSFFMNPVVPADLADRVVGQALAEGLAATAAQVPRFPAGDGQVKLAAGWLIERAGVAKGYRRGPVGISSRHALALVHHGGGHTADLLALARHVRDTVDARFGVRLVPEPTLLGVALG